MNKSRRIVAFILACTLFLTACSSSNPQVQDPVPTVNDSGIESQTESITPTEAVADITDETKSEEKPQDTEISSDPVEDTEIDPSTLPEEEIVDESEEEVIPNFYGLNDPELLQYVEDTVYAGLVDEFKSEDYIIEDVSAVYYSKDYLQELEYNSKSNIFFGYTL